MAIYKSGASSSNAAHSLRRAHSSCVECVPSSNSSQNGSDDAVVSGGGGGGPSLDRLCQRVCRREARTFHNDHYDCFHSPTSSRDYHYLLPLLCVGELHELIMLLHQLLLLLLW